MRKLVIVSLDAMFGEDMDHYGEDSFLRRWMDGAARCTQVSNVFPALTYPTHCTIITGCEPDQHGVGQNQPFQPGKEASMRVWYWTEKDISRPGLFHAVKKAGGRCASILWPVSGKHPAIRWNFPEVLALPGENQVLKMLRYGSAPWIIQMELKHGKERVSTKEPHLSDYATILAEDVIRAHQPDLTAVHLVDLDEMRHKYGVESKEAHEAFRRNESRVERIWQAMQQTPGMEDALLAVVSDHGQGDVSRKVNLGELLSAAGLSGCAQVQSNGMTAYFFPGEKSEEGLRQAEGWLREHGGAHGICHVYSRSELDDLHCVSGPAFAVEAAPEVVFSDGLPQAKREKATHGYGVHHRYGGCILAVRGKGIRPCVLPPMPMRDVAPTLAGLMGVELPHAQGDSHHSAMLYVMV